MTHSGGKAMLPLLEFLNNIDPHVYKVKSEHQENDSDIFIRLN